MFLDVVPSLVILRHLLQPVVQLLPWLAAVINIVAVFVPLLLPQTLLQHR